MPDINFNLPTVSTTYTDFPEQLIENIDAALQQLSVGLPTTNPTAANVPTGAIRWDTDLNRWRKWNGSAYVDLTSTYNLNAQVSVTKLFLGDSNNNAGGTNSIFLGAGNDLRIFHDGSNSWIRDYNGAGNLKITTNQLDITNNGNSEFMAKFIQGASVELYEDNTKRFETTTAGCKITGELTTTGQAAIGTNITTDGSGGVADRLIRVGAGRTGNGNSYLDLVGDATYTTYGARLIRGNTGANTTTILQHRGTGQLQIQAQDAGKIALNTDGATRIFINQTGQVSIGSTNQQKLFDVHSAGTPEMIIRSSNTSSHDAKLTLRGSRTGAPTDINQIIFETNDNGSGAYTAGSRLGSIICGKQQGNTTRGFFDFRLNDTTITNGTLGTSDVSKLYIRPSNQVGFGTTNPQRLLELSSADQTSIIRLHSSDGGIVNTDRIGMIEFSGNDANNSGICAFIEAIASGNNGQTDLRFAAGTAGSTAEAMRLTRDKILVFGHTTQRNSRTGTSNFQPDLQIHSDSVGAMSITRYSNSTGSGRLHIQKARGTAASPSVVTNGDVICDFTMSGYDGSNFTNGARINATVNGTVGSNAMPTDITFQIRDDSGTLNTNYTMTHDRFFGIIKTSPALPLHIKQLTDNAGSIRIEDSGSNTRYMDIDVTDGHTKFSARNNTSNGTFAFVGNNNSTELEYLRILVGGGVSIGSTTMQTSGNTPDKLSITGGNISTNSSIVAGRGSGSIGLTPNDGYGNANLAFNHVNGKPDNDGNAARIEVNTDSNTGATMMFELKSGVTQGTAVNLTNILDLTETQIVPRKNFIPNNDSTVDIGSNNVRFANGYFDTLYGDGSNLTGISQAVRRIKHISSSTEAEFNGTDYQNHLSVTFDNVQSTSRFVVFTNFEIKSESTQGGTAQARIASTNGNILVQKVVGNSDTDYDDGQFSFMEFDASNNTNDRTYHLQVRSTTSNTSRGARIRNASIIVLEFSVS